MRLQPENTMSSFEISKAVKSRHYSVIRSVRRLADAGVVDAVEFDFMPDRGFPCEALAVSASDGKKVIDHLSKKKRIRVKSKKIMHGNPPSAADGWELFERQFSVTGNNQNPFDIYTRIESEWVSVKFVASKPTAGKANYWISISDHNGIRRTGDAKNARMDYPLMLDKSEEIAKTLKKPARGVLYSR